MGFPTKDDTMKYFDLHTHTVLSDGTKTPKQLLDAAEKKGYGLGISDHIFCCKMLTLRDVEHYLDELDRYNVLHGVEANLTNWMNVWTM